MTEAPPPPGAIDFDRLHITGKQRFLRLIAANFINLVVGLVLYIPIAFLVSISASTGSLNGVPIIGQLFSTIPALEGSRVCFFFFGDFSHL